MTAIKQNFNTVSMPVAKNADKPTEDEAKALAEYQAQKDMMNERGISYSLVLEGESEETAVEVGFKREPVTVDIQIPELADIMEAHGGIKALENLLVKEVKKIIKPDLESGTEPRTVTADMIIASLASTGSSAKVTPEGITGAIKVMRDYLESIERPEQAIAAMLQGLGNNEKQSILPKAGVLKAWKEKCEVVRDYVRTAGTEYADSLTPEIEAVFGAWDKKLSDYLEEMKQEQKTVSMF